MSTETCVICLTTREDGDDAVSELRKALVERLQRRVEGATAEACNDALDDCGDEEDEAVFVLLFQAASTPGSDGDGELTEEEFLRRLDATMAASEEAAAAEEELAAVEAQLRAMEARAAGQAALDDDDDVRGAIRAPEKVVIALLCVYLGLSTCR